MNNHFKLTLAGWSTSTKKTKNFELDGVERISFISFLDGLPEKTVRLEHILGIGGEGIVLSDKMDTKEHHYEKGWDEKKEREVAVKFVKFEKDENEDFEGPEYKCGMLKSSGIDKNGEFVESQYFMRLFLLGDFQSATHTLRGYSRPYIDFGVSKIHEKYFYVIGELKVLKL